MRETSERNVTGTERATASAVTKSAGTCTPASSSCFLAEGKADVAVGVAASVSAGVARKLTSVCALPCQPRLGHGGGVFVRRKSAASSASVLTRPPSKPCSLAVAAVRAARLSSASHA